MGTPKPMAHQNLSLSFLASRNRVFDMSDPGTGKTPVHIWDSSRRRRKGSGKILVMAPRSLLRSAWGNDFFTFAPDMRVSIARAENRVEAFEETADAYITNIDAADWLAKQKPAFFKDFEHLIIDESTAYKHNTSKRSKAMASIRKYFDVRRLLSGTPNPNGICDIWHQMYLLDDGRRLGSSFFKFRSATCVPEQVGPMSNMIRWVDRDGIEQVVGRLLQDITIRHKFEDCVDIPPNHRFAIRHTMNARHARAYDEMRKSSLLDLQRGGVISAVNGAVLYSKLLQIASGAVYSRPNEDYVLLDRERYELILDLVEARQKCIVFFNWKHQRDELIREAVQRKMSHAIIDGDITDDKISDQIVTDYQAGVYKVLFAHPRSAGHGLTLTKGTTTIYASPTPDLEHFLQAMKRIYRIGQTERTETIMILAEGTLDERVWESLQGKDVKQSSLLSLLQS